MSMCRAISQSLAFMLLWVFMADFLRADGGLVLAEKQVGTYRVVLFGNPSPLRAGPVVALMPLGVLLYIWRGYLKKRRAP